MGLLLQRTDADLTTVEIDGEVSTYNPETDRVVMLNTTATDVFTLCDGTMDADAIADLLARAYDVDPHEARSGVVAVVEMLVAERLIHLVHPDS